MSDYDRDPEPIRETERTTVVHTDGDRGRGGGVIIAVILLIAVLALLFFLFGGNLNRAADEVGVNVNVDAPKVEVPDLNVNLPDIDVHTDGDATENKTD